MAFDEDIIRPWGLFLLDIAKEVRNEELQNIKLILGNKLTARDWESIREPVDLFELLEDKRLISEDDTALLRELFRRAEYTELIPRLNEYEANRKKYLERVSMLAGRRGPLFVGRESYIRTILDFFKEARHPGVRCVCLWGMAGTGKTKLGAETSTIYAEMCDNPKPRLVLVDLNKKHSIADVGMAFLSSVGKPVEANAFKLHLVYDWIISCREEYIFLFDNADDLLKPTSLAKDHFQNMLKQALEWQQNSNIKIIITSRYAGKFPHLDNHPNFKEIEVQSLEMEEAVQLLFKSVQQDPRSNLPVKGQQLITKEQAVRLAEHCGNNPQALQAVASQLRSGKDPEAVLRLLANPMKMEQVLNDQSLWGLGQDTTQESGRESNQVLKCLGVMFEDMNPNLKLHLIRLAVFPGLFSQTWGLKILSDVDQEGSCRQSQSNTLESELDDVAGTSLLLRESLDNFKSGRRRDARAGEKFYSMHPLVRCLCLMKVEADEKMNRAFQSGLVSFMDECFQQLRQFTACGSLQRLEKEKANITQYLELEMHRTFSGKPHPLTKYLPEYQNVLRRSNMVRESDILVFMARFMFTKERTNFFRHKAEAAKRFGDMPGWVNYQGWYADQELQLYRYKEAETAITDPLSYCQTQLAMTPDLREGYSQCLYVKGNLLIQKPQDSRHIQSKMREEGTKILKECVQMRDRHLGNSLVRARSINALGSAYFHGMKYEEALEQHKLALEMLKTVTQNHPETHPDFAYYLMNIGTCYHELGYSYSRSITQKEKGRRYFEQAIRTYEDGQEALRGIGLDKTSIMGTMLKNLAMTYCEREDYKTALYHADRATCIRVKTLGDDHPDVARAHYFVGSLYMSLGNKERKAGKNIFEIEEYKKARECFDRALIVEFKVGYGRRSQDYTELKEDIEKLFNILNKKREWQRYSFKFKEHEKGNFVLVTELEASSSSAGSEASTSSAGTKSDRHDRKRAGGQLDDPVPPPVSPLAPDSEEEVQFDAADAPSSPPACPSSASPLHVILWPHLRHPTCLEDLDQELTECDNFTSDQLKKLSRRNLFHNDSQREEFLKACGAWKAIHVLNELARRLSETQSMDQSSIMMILGKMLRKLNRKDIRKVLISYLHSGAIGPSMDEKIYIRDLSYRTQRDIGIELSKSQPNDVHDWRCLARDIGCSESIEFFAKKDYPGMEVLQTWRTCNEATVGKLYEWAVKGQRWDIVKIMEKDMSNAGSLKAVYDMRTTTTTAAATAAAATFASKRARLQAPAPTFPPIYASPQAASAIFPPMHAGSQASATLPSTYASPQAASATFPPIRASLQSAAIFPPMHAGSQAPAAAKVSQESRWLHLDTTDDGNQVHWDFLTDCPQELTLQDNEAVISCGIRFSPSRAKLSKPIKITLDHNAHFSNPRRAEIVFYTRKKDSKSFERIPASTSSYPHCDVRVKDLDLYVDHFSDWWIVALLTRYFVGKRVNCMPYVLPPVRKEFSHCVYLCIYDDLPDVNDKIDKEMKKYTELHPTQQMFIERKHGDINIKLFEGLKENEKEIGKERLGKRDIYLVDRKQFPFEVKPLEPGERQKFLKFTLNQKESPCDPTSMKFPLPYDDMGTIRTTATTTAATLSSTHVGLQAAAAAATFPPLHAGAQAAEVSTLSQDNLESDRKLDKLSKHMPTETYTTLCTYLGIDYSEAKKILRGVRNDYREATRDCLAQWKTRTGGNMDELETILQDAEVGDLVKYIK